MPPLYSISPKPKSSIIIKTILGEVAFTLERNNIITNKKRNDVMMETHCSALNAWGKMQCLTIASFDSLVRIKMPG